MFSLLKSAINSFNNGRFIRNGAEIIVEDSFADYIQRHWTELCLHVKGYVIDTCLIEFAYEGFIATDK